MNKIKMKIYSNIVQERSKTQSAKLYLFILV